MSGFRTFGWLTLQPPVIGRPDFRPKPVPNRFGTGLKPVFGLERLKTGQLCPVIGRSKSGQMVTTRTFENRKSENRT